MVKETFLKDFTHKAGKIIASWFDSQSIYKSVYLQPITDGLFASPSETGAEFWKPKETHKEQVQTSR